MSTRHPPPASCGLGASWRLRLFFPVTNSLVNWLLQFPLHLCTFENLNSHVKETKIAPAIEFHNSTFLSILTLNIANVVYTSPTPTHLDLIIFCRFRRLAFHLHHLSRVTTSSVQLQLGYLPASQHFFNPPHTTTFLRYPSTVPPKRRLRI